MKPHSYLFGEGRVQGACCTSTTPVSAETKIREKRRGEEGTDRNQGKVMCG